MGSLRLTDIAKPGKDSASGSGTTKHKEPDTPDLGSGGASTPVWKQVRIEGATYRHGSAPNIHIGASLHDVLEGDKDDNKEEEDNGDDDDNVQGETPKHEGNKGEEDDEDNAQFVDPNPVPPKHWTWSQQAQRDEQESSLVKEILSDEEKKSQMEVQKASKESVPSSNDQPGSQDKEGKPVFEEAGLQDPENEDESAAQEVTNLHQKQGANESLIRGSG